MNERKPKRCGAKTRAGTPCQRWARPNGRCNLHGGKSLAGPASATYQTGRHSKYLDGRVLERYEQAKADTALLELADEIALIDAQIASSLAALNIGGTDERWVTLRAQWERFMSSDGKDAQLDAIGAIDTIMREGSRDMLLWVEVNALIERRRRLVESEVRRAATALQMVSIDALMFYLGATIDAIKESAFKHAQPEVARSIVLDANESYKRIVGAPSDID